MAATWRAVSAVDEIFARSGGNAARMDRPLQRYWRDVHVGQMHAIHVPGRYGTIQDLWVHPDWRSRAVGRKLLAAFFELAREEGARRIEVGLPRESFEKIAATEAFYLANGFRHLGPRMRRKL